MIRVCENCSNIDVDALIKVVGEDKVEVGCIGHCAEFDSETFGYINDEFIVEENQEAWITKIPK